MGNVEFEVSQWAIYDSECGYGSKELEALRGGVECAEIVMDKNEKIRLAKLKAYEILDTPPEQAFDRITKIAADIV